MKERTEEESDEVRGGMRRVGSEESGCCGGRRGRDGGRGGSVRKSAGGREREMGEERERDTAVKKENYCHVSAEGRFR